MFLRAAFSMMCLVAAPCVFAQGTASYAQASAELEPQFVEMVDRYLDLTCEQEVVAFDTVYGERYIPKVFWNTIIEPFDEQIEVDPSGWRAAHLFNDPLKETFDPSSLNTMSFNISAVVHILDSLDFMAAFEPSDEGEAAVAISDLLVLRSKVASSSALSKCLRADNPASHVSETQELRSTVLENAAAAEHCIQWDIFVQRYLDIPFETMTVAERFDAGGRAYADHDEYLIQSGISAECEEDA